MVWTIDNLQDQLLSSRGRCPFGKFWISPNVGASLLLTDDQSRSSLLLTDQLCSLHALSGRSLLISHRPEATTLVQYFIISTMIILKSSTSPSEGDFTLIGKRTGALLNRPVGRYQWGKLKQHKITFLAIRWFFFLQLVLPSILK